MLPLRRFAVVQASRALRPSTFRSSFHTSTWRAFPVPTSTDHVTDMSSKNTAGHGLNEKGSGNRNVPNEHNPTQSTSNPGRAASTPIPRPPSSQPSSPTADDVKHAVKRTARKASAKAEEAAHTVGESVRHTAATARHGLSQAKEDVTHAAKQTKTRAKSAAKQAQADMQTEPAVRASGYTPVSTGATGYGQDGAAMKAKMADTAQGVKAGLSSVVQSVKSAAQNVAESVKATTSSVTAKARDKAASTSERLSSMGERMEARFEKIGDDLMKSGEAIERRNQEPDPQPLPLDEVDHMPNPKNLNDVLPGTGPKDSKRNDIADSRDRGQFPG